MLAAAVEAARDAQAALPEMEIRCPSRIHGVLNEGRMEVKCHSKRCGAGAGATVLHYFDPLTGELLETKRFADPQTFFNRKEESTRCP
jgi:hypothetical protein